MKIELITCANSPQCVSAKMFLDLQSIDYVETVVSHESMSKIGFDTHEMPVLMIDGEVEMSGFDADVLKELFENN